MAGLPFQKNENLKFETLNPISLKKIGLESDQEGQSGSPFIQNVFK